MNLRLALVFPWDQMEPWRGKKSSFVFPPLALPLLAALTPPHIDLKIIDEAVDPLNYPYPDFDAVAFSVVTPSAPRAYQLAQIYREKGAKIIMGGLHPTVLPDESGNYADSVVIGEAELIWRQLLNDLENDELAPVYKSAAMTPPEMIPFADRSGLNLRKYAIPYTVQATRGCPWGCSFCCTTRLFGSKVRMRPVDQVIEEIKSFPRKFFVFTDDNLFFDKRYGTELVQALKPLKKWWVTQTDMSLANHPNLIKSAVNAGLLGILVGFETILEENRRDIGKGIKSAAFYKNAVEVFHRNGLLVQGSFVVGFDHDTPDMFPKLLRFCRDLKLDTANFCILTPLPGTRIYDRLNSQNRIITPDWKFFNRHSLVFQPEKLTPRELLEGRNFLYRNFYSWKSIWRRKPGKLRHNLFYWTYNINFRRGIREIVNLSHKLED